MSTSSNRVIKVCLFLIASILGASAVFALFERSVTVEALTNVTVAIGTLALAYFTWQSVSKTNDVIRGEDRRHQQQYAPLVIMRSQTIENGKLKFFTDNIGMGMARNVVISANIDWTSSEFQSGIAPLTPYPPIQNIAVPQQQLDVIPTRPADIAHLNVPMIDVPQHYNGYRIHRVEFAYTDMFGNSYKTTYEDWHANQRFTWDQPAPLTPATPQNG